MSKIFYQIAGFTCLALGFIGIALPIMPTTPFLILAAFCFKHGSPKHYEWLLSNPLFGKSVKDWDEHRVITPKNKLLACSVIFICIGYSVFFKPLNLILKILLTILGFAISFFILSCKNHPDGQKMVSMLSPHDSN